MSNSDGKVKVIKNPDRNKVAPYKPYVPQYQVHGVEPGEYHGAVVPSGAKIAGPSALPLDNPRAKRPAMRQPVPQQQPYASAMPSPIGRGRGMLPNVGNNMEQGWSGVSGVDGAIIDDLEYDIDPNHPMIDNNEYMSDEALGYQSGLTAEDISPDQMMGKVSFEQEIDSVPVKPSAEDLFPIVADLEEDSFLLIVSGVAICSGPLEEIQDQARALVFGEHEMCDGNPIPVDDIIILKKVKIKVGLFLE